MAMKSSKYFILYFKGVAMGMADIIPGVSGGTIALISGIYQELIASIDKIDGAFLKSLFSKQFTTTWKEYNLTFLLTLFAGIATSVLALSHFLYRLIEEQPIALWSFFFGLIVISAFHISRQITSKHWKIWLSCMVGIAIAYGISVLTPSGSEHGLMYLFFCGMFAIIAMILPGVSGAFILVLLGAYEIALETLDRAQRLDPDAFVTLLVMGLGALVGLKLFSRILNWMFDHHKNTTLAILVGFMIGSLHKIWPWKKQIAETEQSINVLPNAYDGNPQIGVAIGMAVLGIGIILLLEQIAKKSTP